MVKNKLELVDLDKQLDVILQAQEVAAKALKNNPSLVILSRCKEILAAESKNLLLLEYQMYVGESVDEEWKSNSAESFELIGSLLKKVTLMEKEISQKLEETPIDSIAVNVFASKPSNPLATEEGNYRSSFKPQFSITDRDQDGSSNRNCEKSVPLHENVSSHKAESIFSFRDGCQVNPLFLDYQEGKLFDSRINSVNDFVKKNFIILSEEGFKQVLLTLTHRLLMAKCSSSVMNSSRSLFDRGKYKLKFDSKLRFPDCMGFQFLDRLCRKIVQKLVYHSGFQSDGFSSDSISCMLANNGFITTAWYMFDNMLHCEVMRRLFEESSLKLLTGCILSHT
ncbi:uncharacterized protein LOC113358357 isoform X2 [Papaver somniferum]|uniref:uncharacterized protein LOC113358357 isoform X1 n=1 Tax=Papaver somniferum TaxID=3469 RepID=UPI000E6F939A|nr:uncharacterized protein LOC113358357 isoform X1 [Papaver somniferum]XP_026457690.1 uncharacterized protein LOC113358357 isoform X2 [Papaver somniferum]